jgi:hypothetical protein
MSLGLYIQMTGRLLRTIGGNIDEHSRRQGGRARARLRRQHRPHGPLDFIRPKDTKS